MAKVTEQMEIAELFAEIVAQTRYADLPPDTVEVTKKSILDTIGVAVAATGLVREPKTVVDLLKEAGGKEEATVWGFGGKLPAWAAAFANGAMAHALDYDDVFDDEAVHPSATTVPAALAVAERAAGVSGKDFITAVALGNDIIGRLGKSVVWKRDWFLTPLFGVFSSAAAAGKVLGLDRNRLVDALGIGLCQAAGTMEIVYGTGSNIRGIYDSFVGKAGVLSALMAQRGISGVKSSLEGKAGLYAVYFHGEYDRDILTADLGRRFDGTKVSFKPWPCCRFSHPYLTALLALARERDISIGDVKGITVETSSVSHELCIPPEARVRPATPLDAKFSIPYILARGLLKGGITLADFSPEAIKDDASAALASRISSRLNTGFDSYGGRPPGKVHLETVDGKVYSQYEEFAYGNPRNPISQEDLVRKFCDCASYSAAPFPEGNVEEMVELIANLEAVSDVSQIARLLP
ncbi:MAG: MmgE/PrpD family protein [Chloroflexi bacterium]|nr:MmgE/PrpD family protein [Chloroflexota bacterium]